jgi:FlaA1/EpsC-like NDP-sugar epimerase
MLSVVFNMKKRSFRSFIRWPLVILLHAAAVCLAFFAAVTLSYGYIALAPLAALPVVLCIKITFLYLFGACHASFRHVSFDDVLWLFCANSFATLVSVLVTLSVWPLTVTLFILDWGLCFSFLLLIRVGNRPLYFHLSRAKQAKNIRAIIVGAGEAGIIVLNELKRNPHTDVEVVAFIDDDRSKRNLRIHGVRVWGGRRVIPSIVERFRVSEIIIAIPSASGAVIRSLVSLCQFPHVRIKIVPGLYKIITDEVSVSVRDIKPEDLLGRETVVIDETAVRTHLKDTCVLVTGAAGSIGSELIRQIALCAPSKLVLLDHNENDLYFLERELETECAPMSIETVIGDIKDIGLLKHVFARVHPQVVFHAAAFKHVPLMEANPCAVVENNIIGTRNVVYAADHYKVERFVFISTDKAVNPTSLMGTSKRIGEMLIQAKAAKSKTKFMAVRFGNVLGSKGSVVPLFKKQIEAGGPVTVMDPEVRRYFMSTREAVALVLQASVLGSGGEIFVLDMGEQIKILDLARDMITLAGLRPDTDIAIEFTGLRPGEKMFEEILLDKEQDAATKHDKIFVTRPGSFHIRTLNKQIKALARFARHRDNERVRATLQSIVPPSSNSK